MGDLELGQAIVRTSREMLKAIVVLDGKYPEGVNKRLALLAAMLAGVEPTVARLALMSLTIRQYLAEDGEVLRVLDSGRTRAAELHTPEGERSWEVECFCGQQHEGETAH